MTRQTQIISFPIQKARADEPLRDDFEGTFQLKLEAAQMLNDAAAGIYIMSPGNIQAIKKLNEQCRKMGLTPLDFDPS